VNLACSWADKSIEVYFNPADITSSGFNVDYLRGEMIDALAMLNEEGQGQYDLIYSGDTTAEQITGSVVVNNDAVWFCSDNVIGKAFGLAPSGTCDSSQPLVRIILEDSCNPGTPRDLRTGWPGSTFGQLGIAGAQGYENVIGHELAHMIGIPDEGAPQGLGCCNFSHTSWRMTYPIDVVSIQAMAGLTNRRPYTSDSATGTAWGTPLLMSTGRTSSPPHLDGNLPSSMGPLRSTYWRPNLQMASVHEGTHGSWSTLPNASSPTAVNTGSALANSDYGETMVVWPGNCNNLNACDIEWAWTNNTTTWTRGTLVDADTHSKAYVEYDLAADRFVLAYIDSSDARITTRSAPAVWAPGWTSETATVAAPYRHLGGMAFNSSGAGLLVASVDISWAKGYLAQFRMVRSGSVYTLTGAAWLTSPAVAARTRRPFGISYDDGSNRTIVVWRDVGSPRPMAVSTKTGLGTANYFSSPTFPITGIVNGVTVAYDDAADEFVAGFTL